MYIEGRMPETFGQLKQSSSHWDKFSNFTICAGTHKQVDAAGAATSYFSDLALTGHSEQSSRFDHAQVDDSFVSEVAATSHERRKILSNFGDCVES